MTSRIDGQLDALALLEPAPPKIDLSALVGFTYYETDPDELDRISLEWSKAYYSVKHPQWRMFPGWRDMQTGRNGVPGHHLSFTYNADLRCHTHWHSRMCAEREADPCQCVGGYLYKIYCSDCDWWTPIQQDENHAAESYLDHCWPGWRELPVIEGKMKPTGGYTYTFPKDYPEDWKVDGAPIRDCRGMTKHGTRHSPGHGPFKGYKAAVIRECKVHVRD